MTIYNVSHVVVDLIDADTPEAAVAELSRRLSAAGFEPYPWAEGDNQVFVNDDQSAAARQLLRGDADSYSRADIVHGTGWSRGQRFRVVRPW